MSDDDSQSSIVKSLKTEWSLFWGSIAGEDGDEDKSENPFETGVLKVLSLDEVKQLTRALSHDRRQLNRRLESLTKELDLNSAKLESLRLVGGSDEDTVKKIGELHDQGQRLSHELADIDKKLRFAREQEESLRRRPSSA